MAAIKRLALVSLWAGLVLLASVAIGQTRLFQAATSDPSYKVRMQALRLLSKKLKDKPLSKEALKAFERAALEDQEHLVRGMACVALGTLGSPAALPILTRAQKDSSAFVRAQAKRAITKIEARSKPVGASSARPVLVLGVDPGPEGQAPKVLWEELERAMKRWAQPGERFALSGPGAGFRLGGTLEVSEEGPKTVLTVRISIATWPEKKLRHVVSAQAGARGTPSLRLQKRLLEAAVERAMKDSLDQLKGESR